MKIYRKADRFLNCPVPEHIKMLGHEEVIKYINSKRLAYYDNARYGGVRIAGPFVQMKRY